MKATRPLSFELPARIEAWVASDQCVYVGLSRNSDTNIERTSIRKLDTNFAERWSTAVDLTPAGICLSGNRVFAHSWDVCRNRGILYCFDEETGHVRWSSKIRHAEPSPPPFATRSCVLLPAMDKVLAFAIKNGKRLWSADTGQVNFPIMQHPSDESLLLV
jgi:outer membrane protein assembly factor BamB